MGLASLFTNLGIETTADPSALDRASRDASLFRVVPSLIVAPKNEQEVETIVRAVADRKRADPSLSLTVRSAGTDMGGGPLTESIVVDMQAHFTRFLGVDSESQTAVTEPGVFYRDFEPKTLAKGLLLPSYPASRELCTVGGMVANNSGGEKTLAYGKTDRYVTRLRMVCADGHAHEFHKLSAKEWERAKQRDGFEGELYQRIDRLIRLHEDEIRAAKPDVSKNSAGYALWNIHDPADDSYDLTKLIVGSQGTFGIVTQIEFALVKPKPHSRMLIAFLSDMKRIAEVAEHVLAHHPESFESYDDHTMKVALKVFPDLVRRMKGNLLTLAWEFLPDVRLMLSGGIPKLVLIAEFTADTETEAAEAAGAARADIASLGIRCRVTKSEHEGEKYWTIRRESFSLLRKHIKKLRTAPFIDDFVVRPKDLSRFLPELYEILDRYDLIFTVAGHVGDGNFHIIPLMDVTKPDTEHIIDELSHAVYDLVTRYRGSITGEHNDGLIRTPYLEKMFGGEMVKRFDEVKACFDPDGIFNPHKKTHGSFTYAMEHLDKTS